MDKEESSNEICCEKPKQKSKVKSIGLNDIMTNRDSMNNTSNTQEIISSKKKLKDLVVRKTKITSMLKIFKKKTTKAKMLHIPKSIKITMKNKSIYLSSLSLYKIKGQLNQSKIHFTYAALSFNIFNLITKPQSLIEKNHNDFVLHIGQLNTFIPNLDSPPMNVNHENYATLLPGKNPMSYPCAMNKEIDLTKDLPKCLFPKQVNKANDNNNDYCLLKHDNDNKPFINSSIEDNYPHSLDNIKHLPKIAIIKFINEPDDPIPIAIIASKIQSYKDNDYHHHRVIKLAQMPIARKPHLPYTPQSFPHNLIKPLQFKSDDQHLQQRPISIPKKDVIPLSVVDFLINFNLNQSFIWKSFLSFANINQVFANNGVINQNDANQMQNTLIGMYDQLSSFIIELKRCFDNADSHHDSMKNLAENYFKNIDSLLSYYIGVNDHYTAYQESIMNEFVKDIKDYNEKCEEIRKIYGEVKEDYDEITIKNEDEGRSNRVLNETMEIRRRQLDDIKKLMPLFQKETDLLMELIRNKLRDVNKEKSRIENSSYRNDKSINMSRTIDKSYHKSRTLGINLNSSNVTNQLNISLRNLEKENDSLKDRLLQLESNKNIPFIYKQQNIFQSPSSFTSQKIMNNNMTIITILIIILIFQFILYFYLK